MNRQLDVGTIAAARQRIEDAIVPAMEALYGNDRRGPGPDFQPGFKPEEIIVSYYDYCATGVSVLAALAARGQARARELIDVVRRNTDHYVREVIPQTQAPPVRRLLFHLALAYERLAAKLGGSERQWYADLFAGQVRAAWEHNHDFFPAVRDLHLTPANNHTAIFMQAIYHCGRVLGRQDWVDGALEFARRFFASGHPDGYFEENTNAEREGGPSLVYTPLTAGCLYDLLGRDPERRERFVRAGNSFRQLLNQDFDLIPIADERTNHNHKACIYGLALHSLTAPGRGLILEVLDRFDFDCGRPEALAVLHHELGLMQTGATAACENRIDGAFRLTLPLGVLRRGGFTAGLSALRALNREIKAYSDYCLDQQNMVYLSHRDRGVILSGFKSKRDPAFSTFRVGDDAYTVRTGSLEMGTDWAEARLAYRTFKAGIRWELGDRARLILTADTDETVTSSLPFAGEAPRVAAPHAIETLAGFSPYAAQNLAAPVRALVFRWQGRLAIEFGAGAASTENGPE